MDRMYEDQQLSLISEDQEESRYNESVTTYNRRIMKRQHNLRITNQFSDKFR